MLLTCARRVSRGSLGASLLASSLWLGSLPLHAQGLERPSGQYLDLVARYAAGDRAGAVADLAGWPERELKAEIDGLAEWVRRADQCGACPIQTRLSSVSFTAAVMMHTDRDELELRPPLGTEEETAFWKRGFHARMAGDLIQLSLSRPGGRERARRWYLAMTLRTHGLLLVQEALQWGREGLRWFPNDGELRIALGTVAEVFGTYSFAAPRVPGSSFLRSPLSDLSTRPTYLGEARRHFEAALAATPSLEEAQLHLGRTLWALGEAAAARRRLSDILARSGDRRRSYLAHLFLGQVDEDAGRLEAAEREYRNALALEPDSQTAAVALSAVLRLSGDVTRSREVLVAALGFGGRRAGRDAFATYLLDRPDDAEQVFAALRDEAGH